MQYIAIKEHDKDGVVSYSVNAIPLKNKSKSVVQKIPHPLGDDVLEFSTLEDAKNAVERSGFSYILPNGEKKDTSFSKKESVVSDLNEFDEIVYKTIKNKILSNNSSVVASAVLALAEFPKTETFSILYDKLGEENDMIRKNAILGICRHFKRTQDDIIPLLQSSDWIVRNSVLSCIKTILEIPDVDCKKFISPLINACNDSNPIVQANAISILAFAYQKYKKNNS